MESSTKAPSRAERSRQILAVLAKHGLGAARGGAPEHARQACEELGTTFIKLGQLLSTRADLVPPEYRAELAKLQDDVPPVDSSLIAAIVEEELGSRPGALFAEWDPVPIASASIGQAYAARLADGTALVVKVRKPEIRELVERDLEILHGLLSSGEHFIDALEEADVEGLLDEFGDTLRNELDYQREARNIERFREIFKGESGFVLPQVRWEYSTGSVLTMTAVPGEKITEAPLLTPKRQELTAQRIARFCLEPALVHGIFHADPHPGNMLVQSSGVVGVIDFGMVVRLSDAMRRGVLDLFLAMERRDVQRMVDKLVQVAPSTRPVDRVGIATRIGRLLERYMGESLDRVQIGPAIGELLEIVRTNEMRTPGPVAMLMKAIAMSEGIIASIAPDKTLADFMEPIAKRVTLARLSPEDWAQRAGESAMDAAELSIDLPRRADRVLADVERGNLRVWARLEEFDPALDHLERLIERANATMIAAACIVGLTILLVAYHPAGWQAVAAWFFWIGFAIAVAVVARTFWRTVRKGG